LGKTQLDGLSKLNEEIDKSDSQIQKTYDKTSMNSIAEDQALVDDGQDVLDELTFDEPTFDEPTNIDATVGGKYKYLKKLLNNRTRKALKK
jgi:hypothetical protein